MSDAELTPDQIAAEKAAEKRRHEVESALAMAMLFLQPRMKLAIWWIPATWNEFAADLSAAFDPIFAAHDDAAKAVWPRFDSLDAASVDAERAYKAKLVSDVSDATKRAIEKAVAWIQGQDMAEADANRILAYIAGANANQASGIMTAWTNMAADGIDAAVIAKTLADMAAKAIKDRAKTLAGDALWTAVQMGRQAAGTQEQRATNMQVTKTWVTARDELVCDSCGPMDGLTVPVGALFQNLVSMPPMHSACRCHTEINVSE